MSIKPGLKSEKRNFAPNFGVHFLKPDFCLSAAAILDFLLLGEGKKWKQFLFVQLG